MHIFQLSEAKIKSKKDSRRLSHVARDGILAHRNELSWIMHVAHISLLITNWNLNLITNSFLPLFSTLPIAFYICHRWWKNRSISPHNYSPSEEYTSIAKGEERIDNRELLGYVCTPQTESTTVDRSFKFEQLRTGISSTDSFIILSRRPCAKLPRLFLLVVLFSMNIAF